jgi:hypothetical protein
MKKNLLITSIAFSILSLQFSCQTTTGPAKTPGSGGYVSKGDLKKHKDFELPENYSQITSFRTLNLLPNFVYKTLSTAINSDTTEKVIISKNQSETAKIHLETFMGQIKRFNTKAAQSATDSRARIEELQDIGFLKQDEIDNSYNVKLSLNAIMVLGGENTFYRNGQTDRVYTATIDFSITKVDSGSETDDIVGRSFKVVGESKPRKFFRNIVTGEYLTGFSQKDEAVAIKEAIFNAMEKALPQFGKQFPVSGKVEHISEFDPTSMRIDRGTFHGLTKNTQVCVWYDDGGVGIPIAYANAVPGEKSTTIKVYKWNTANSRFKSFTESVQQPGFLASGKKLYATSIGLAYPEEWEK